MTTDAPSDTNLLLAYGKKGDEKAFETLAARHVDMIFAVSLRRSNNRQLAEEATQNVLLILAQKARKLSARADNLTAWLHKSTRFEVAKLQRRESRIKKREMAYANETMNQTTQDEVKAFQHLYPILDQAIDNLRTPDREVIVRRYLQGQSFRNIAAALGISEDTAQKRTTRAFERLNQFFKRKAGITVSAAALAAGITQHCAEAAPAACLDLAGKTVPSGLASILTTASITLMSIHKITAVAAVVILLGGTVAIIATNKNKTPEAVANPPAAAAPLEPNQPNPPATPIATETSTPTRSLNDEIAKLEATNPHPEKDELTRRLSVKFAQLLEDLTRELGLTAAQTASIKAVLDARLLTFRSTLDMNEDEMAMITKAGGIIRGSDLREEIADILTEEQLAAFDNHEANQWQTQVESHAYNELAKLTPVLNLTEDQKDRTFERLQTTSEQTLRKDGDIRAFMALQTGLLPSQMELTDMEEASFLSTTFDGPNPPRPDSPEFREKIIDVVGRQIEGKVSHLAPVLDPQQTQRYREHLYQKSVLPMLGIELPDPE